MKPKTTKPIVAKQKPKYAFKTYNGRVKVYYENSVMFCFNQIDFAGYYFFKDDTDLYGAEIHLIRKESGAHMMEIYFKSKEAWLAVNKLLDENM